MNKMFLFGMMGTIAAIFAVVGILDGNHLLVSSNAILGFLATCIPEASE